MTSQADERTDWWLTEDLGAFLSRAGAFLHGTPALHTLLLTVTDTLRERGPHAYGAGTPHFGLWTDGTDRVRGAFVRTPPFDLLLGPLPYTRPDGDSGETGAETGAETGNAAGIEAGDETGDGAGDETRSQTRNETGKKDGAPNQERDRAVAALAEQLAVRVPDLGGVSSDRPTAAAFAAAWQRRTGVPGTLRERQRLYRLGTLIPPDPAPPGRARLAGQADRALLMHWCDGLQRDLGGRPLPDTGAWADSRIAHGRTVLWETPDGTPVSMAGATSTVAGQVRIAAVYTPPELRGRGYAGAATADVSRRIRDAGVPQVLLFTDLANPTSNGLYQRIGYRPVRDFDVYAFAPPPAAAAGSTGS